MAGTVPLETPRPGAVLSRALRPRAALRRLALDAGALRRVRSRVRTRAGILRGRDVRELRLDGWPRPGWRHPARPAGRPVADAATAPRCAGHVARADPVLPACPQLLARPRVSRLVPR